MRSGGYSETCDILNSRLPADHCSLSFLVPQEQEVRRFFLQSITVPDYLELTFYPLKENQDKSRAAAEKLKGLFRRGALVQQDDSANTAMVWYECVIYYV